LVACVTVVDRILEIEWTVEVPNQLAKTNYVKPVNRPGKGGPGWLSMRPTSKPTNGSHGAPSCVLIRRC